MSDVSNWGGTFCWDLVRRIHFPSVCSDSFQLLHDRVVFVIRPPRSEEGYSLQQVVNEGFTEDEGVDGISDGDEELCSIEEGE